jgi:hypothetical protein
MKISPLPDDPKIIADAIVRIVLVSDNAQKARDDVAEIVQQLLEAYPPPHVDSQEFHNKALEEFFKTPDGKKMQRGFQKKVKGLANLRLIADEPPEWTNTL